MRLMNPHHEKEVARVIRQYGYTRRRALLEMTGRDTLGPHTKKRIDFHLVEHPKKALRRHSRLRAGMAMGYSMYDAIPVEDLRKLHKPIKHRPGKRYFNAFPKGMRAVDLAAFNVYLEEIAHIPPCPFPILLRKGWWEDGSWRYEAKESVLWGTF